MRSCFFILLSVFFSSAFAQVINIETKRFLNDTDGFVGRVELNFNINQNVQQVMSVGSNVHAQYVKRRHRLLAIGDFSFIKAGQQDFANAGYQHLRYNYKIANRITWETYIQAQYNKVLLLDRRYQAGTGPRFKLVKKKNLRLYVGTLYMYEYQSQNNDSISGYYNRLNAYYTLSVSFRKMDFSNTTFFQPNIQEPADYRIASDSALEFAISNRLNFKAGFNMLYDTRQPIGIPALSYALRNGLSFKF